MFNFRKSNDAFDILKKLHAASALKKLQAATRALAPDGADRDNRLDETQSFGSNPGQLRMFSTMPFPPQNNPHSSSSCMAVGRPPPATTTAQDGQRWQMIWIALLLRATTTDNLNGCFNWFQPRHPAGPRRSHVDPPNG